MNAGAYGSEIKDILESTTYLDESLNIHTINNNDNQFEYRNSRFSKNKKEIIISAVLKLDKKSKEEINKKIKENTSSRNQKQPINFPSAGSSFKRGNRFYNSRTYRQM